MCFELSGGMRQRAMIAMALSTQPKLLIADEPTTALDVTIQAQVLDLMMELREQLGMAMLFITHDLGVVSKIADNVTVMQRGEVVEAGGADQVLFSAANTPIPVACWMPCRIWKICRKRRNIRRSRCCR